MFSHRLTASWNADSRREDTCLLAEHIGQEADVLFEKAARGKAMHGFTDNYIRVELSPDQAKEEYDNKILRVRLGEFNFDQSSLKAELL